MAEPLEGKRIGPYEIRRLLGKGGMGAVYLAEDHSLDRRVAVKVLPQRLSQDPEIVARFQREARALARLRHPNLMHIYTVGEHEGRPYFAMEYIRGSTLSSLLHRAGPLPHAQAAHIAGEIMSALQKVHQAGVVHRDVKPGNIIIDEDGRAVLMDFGLARREDDVGLTADHTVLGTPSYMSPEQARGERPDARTDIYSLGIVLYEMLTGAPPFKGKSSFQVLRQHIESSVPPPSERRPDVPPELDLVVARAVAKSPDDRYGSVAEMAGDLARVCPDAGLLRLAGDGSPTEPTVLSARTAAGFESTVLLGRRTAPPARRRSLTWWVAAAAAVIVAGLLAWVLFRPGPSPPALPDPGRRVAIDRVGADSVEGRLLAIDVLDDGTTTAKIVGDATGREQTISIRDGDVLRVLDNEE